VTATLLDILTPELVEGMAEFLRSCQTYEGGFASSSHPYYSAEEGKPQVLSGIRPILGEAHGGYTSCAIASWMMLQPYQKAGGKLYLVIYVYARSTNRHFRSQRKRQKAG
jgi:protein farnesyltransferase subunit beta